ncbi:MAG: aldo/keto reductase [Armatimonadota bacterium]|jgi:aryl-alcohol dehydrogenase-like predicted oxidoreductase
MLYRPFGKTSWDVSAIGMGCWNIGNQWGAVDDATAWSTVRTAFDHGMNLFDVAESYGDPNGLSEERLGAALAGIRHQVYIVSKIGHWGERTGQAVAKTTVDMIRLCCHACLHRLRTDWIDVMLCHEGNIEDPSVYLEAFEVLKQRGRIREYGISTDSIEVLQRFNANGTCSVVQVNYSLLNRRAEAEVLPYCEEHNIGVMIRGPLAQGLLSGRYTTDSVFTDSVRSKWNPDGEQRADFEAKAATVERLKQAVEPGEEMVTAALRFTTSPGADPVSIPGPKSPEQAIMNAAAGDRTLSADEMQQLIRLLG